MDDFNQLLDSKSASVALSYRNAFITCSKICTKSDHDELISLIPVAINLVLV